MEYLLRAYTFNAPEIKITQKEYNELEKARNILFYALAIEEKYELIISNYLDFEKQILSTSYDTMVRSNIDYNCFHETRLCFNVRLANILTVVKLYIDQIKQNIKECIPNDSKAANKVKNLFCYEYGKSRDYRFMEALRNYVQHCGLPVHQTQSGARRTSLEDDNLLEYYIEMSSLRRHLEKDSKFKKEVLKELDDKTDLKMATRIYIESISKIHDSVRNMISESVSKAREVIERAHSEYKKVYKGNMANLRAVKMKGEDQISFIPLLLEWDNVRILLQKRNKKLKNLSKRYVTGALKQGK